MPLWASLLTAFGGNAALIAVLAYLAKVLITKWIERETQDRIILFTKLHDKRSDSLAKIHYALYEYVSTCKKFTLVAEHSDEENLKIKFSNLGEVSKKFRDTFQYNKLYLSKELCEKIESVFKSAQLPSHNFIFHLGSFRGDNISEDTFRKEWEKAFITFSKKVPTLLIELESEFRKILRSENFS